MPALTIVVNDVDELAQINSNIGAGQAYPDSINGLTDNSLNLVVPVSLSGSAADTGTFAITNQDGLAVSLTNTTTQGGGAQGSTGVSENVLNARFADTNDGDLRVEFTYSNNGASPNYSAVLVDNGTAAGDAARLVLESLAVASHTFRVKG